MITKQLIPKTELPKLREWANNNTGGYRSYLQERTLQRYVQ